MFLVQVSGVFCTMNILDGNSLQSNNLLFKMKSVTDIQLIYA